MLSGERTLDEGEGADVGVNKLLLDNETQCSKHADTAVSQLRLSPPSYIPDGVVAGSGAAQEVKGIENVGEWLTDTAHLLGICNITCASTLGHCLTYTYWLEMENACMPQNHNTRCAIGGAAAKRTIFSCDAACNQTATTWKGRERLQSMTSSLTSALSGAAGSAALTS